MPGCTRSSLLSNMPAQAHAHIWANTAPHGMKRVLKHKTRLHTRALTNRHTHTHYRHTHTLQSPVYLTSGRPICQSLSLCTFHCSSIKCKWTLFHLIPSHWGIIICGILHTRSHDGAAIERGTTHSACHFSLKDYNPHLSVCGQWIRSLTYPPLM